MRAKAIAETEDQNCQQIDDILTAKQVAKCLLDSISYGTRLWLPETYNAMGELDTST